MKKRKKQIVFLVCIILLVVLGVLLLLTKQPNDSYSGEYQESEDDTIVYGGKKYIYNEHLSNFLFLGVDTREPIESYETSEDAGQADTIFLLSFNRKEKTIRCIVIPRDTMTNIRVISPDGEDLGLTEDHISLQYAFGDGKRKSCEFMKEAVSALLYGIPIQGYCSLNMDGIAVATDALGGVELVIPDDSLKAINPEFEKGAAVTITGANAELFVRYRDTAVSQSALNRMERQMVFVEAFAEKTKGLAAQDNSFVADMLDSVEAYMVTNIGNDMYAKMIEATYDKGMMQTIPGNGVSGEQFDEYRVDDDALYDLVLEMFYKEVQGD